MMQSFFCIGLVTVLWAVVASSLAFGNDAAGGLIGNLDFSGLDDIARAHTCPGTSARTPSRCRRSPLWCSR